MSYVRRNSGSDSNPHSNRSDVNGNSGKFRKSASVEPGPSSLSDDGGSSSKNSGKKKSLSTFWHNLFRSNKIQEKDESQSSDDRQSDHSRSYESVNTILSTNSFSFVNPKKYKGKPVKGKRIPVDTTLPRNEQQTPSSLAGNPSRRKISTFSRLGMKIGLKSKYNLQSCESLQHLNQLEDNRNAGNSYVTTWNSDSSTFTRTNKRRAPLPPPSSSPLLEPSRSKYTKEVRREPIPSAPPASPSPEIIPSPEEPQPSTSSANIQNQVQPKVIGRRRNSIGTDAEIPIAIPSGPGYSTKVVTSSNRYSVEQYLNNGNVKPFVITAGRHRRATSEGLNTNTSSSSNNGTRGRIHVKGKKRAPPPPNPFGDPDVPEEPIPENPFAPAASRSNRNSANLAETSIAASIATSMEPPTQIASSSSSFVQVQNRTQNQSQPQVKSSSVPTPTKIVTAPNRIEAIPGNNPEVNARRMVPAVSVPVIVTEANESPDTNELEDEIAQNILNDRQEQERELQHQQRQHSVSVSVPSTSATNSNTQAHLPLSAPSANSSRQFVSTSTHINHPPVTERDVQVAKNELEALINDNRSGSLETQAKKVDDQVKAQLLQLKRDADKSPLLFFAQKQKQPKNMQSNNSSISMSPPGSPLPNSLQQQPSSPQSPRSSFYSPFQFFNSSNQSPSPAPDSPSQSPPPLPAKPTPRPWYKRSSSSSSKSKNKNTKPVTILPKFSEFDKEATRIVEENRRKSAEQAYNETARELISMFNEFNRDQIQTNENGIPSENSQANLPTASSPVPPTSPTIPPSNNSSAGTNRNSIVSVSTNSAVVPVPAPMASPSQCSSGASVVVSTNGLPSSSKDMKPLPSGNINRSGSLEDTKKLAIVQPQSKSNVTPNSSKPPFPPPATPVLPTSDSTSVKLPPSQPYRYLGRQTATASVTPVGLSSISSVRPTTVSVAPVGSSSVTVRPTTASVAPIASSSVTVNPTTVSSIGLTTISSPNTSNSSNPNPKSIFSYQSSSLFSNRINSSSVPKTTAAISISSSTTTTSSLSSFVPGNEWSCPRCTLRNAHWRNLCDACYFRRDSPVQSTSAIFDRINAQIKASSPSPGSVKPKSTFESPATTTSTTMSTGTVSTPSEKPTQWVKPKTCDVPPGENFLSQLPNKENLAKEGKLEGMKLHDDPEVEELDITKVRQARLAFFTRTKLEQEQQQYQYQQVNESKPNNLALAGIGGDKDKPVQGKERNVFSDGEDDSLDEILQLNANNCNNGPRTWKPLHINRFRPMLESILESEGGGHCNLNKIYENWHLSENNEYSYGQWTNTFMPVQENYANINYKVDHLNSNNLLSNSSSEDYDYDDQDSTMEREGKSKSRHRTSRSSHRPHSQGFQLTNENFLPSAASSHQQRQLTLEDYRKLGAIPKNYRDHTDPHQHMPFPTNSIERNDFSNHNSRSFKAEGMTNPHPYGPSSSSNFSEQSFEGNKLLRKLEIAIANGDHKLAATLAHDLALLRVNCVVNKTSEPFTFQLSNMLCDIMWKVHRQKKINAMLVLEKETTRPVKHLRFIRVYVEDRFMQQGPFLVQVTASMRVSELKMKIQSDWGIPGAFQKWILGRKVAEDDLEILSNYELVHDSMAFLYLVTPDLDKTIHNASLGKKPTESLKKSKVAKGTEASLADCSPKSLPRSKRKPSTDTSIQTQKNISEFSSKSLGRQSKGSKGTKAKISVAASGCQTDSMPPLKSLTINKENETKTAPVVQIETKQRESDGINKPSVSSQEARYEQLSPVSVTKSPVPSGKEEKFVTPTSSPSSLILEKDIKVTVTPKSATSVKIEKETKITEPTTPAESSMKSEKVAKVSGAEPLEKVEKEIKVAETTVPLKSSLKQERGQKLTETPSPAKLETEVKAVETPAPAKPAIKSEKEVKVTETIILVSTASEPKLEKEVKTTESPITTTSPVKLEQEVKPNDTSAQTGIATKQEIDIKSPVTSAVASTAIVTKSDKAPAYPARLKFGHGKEAKDKSSIKIEPAKIAAIYKTTSSLFHNIVDNLHPFTKSLPSATAQSKKSDTNMISPSPSPVPPLITKTERRDTPPKLPPKATNAEKKNLLNDNKILNVTPLKTKPMVVDEKKPVQEVCSQGKLELPPKCPITTNDSPRALSLPTKNATDSKVLPMIGDIAKSESPTPMPRQSKSEGNKLSSLSGLLAKLTSSSPVNSISLTKAEIESVKDDAHAVEASDPKEEAKILLPPWRTSLIIDEDENAGESLPQSGLSVVNEGSQLSDTKKEVKDSEIQSNLTEITIKEEKSEKPVPIPRQRMDNIKSSAFTGTGLPCNTTATSATPKPGSLAPLTAILNSITLNITPQQNYLLKKPSSFLPNQKKESSVTKETSEVSDPMNKSSDMAVSIAPSLPPKEPIITNGHSEVEPNWNPEPIPKRRSKIFKKVTEKTSEEITVEIKPINTDIPESIVSENTKIENKEGNVAGAQKPEPIYENPNNITLPNSNSGSVDGYCQTTLAFPAKTPKSPQPPQNENVATVATKIIRTGATNANSKPTSPVPIEVSTERGNLTEMARKDSNSSIINMESRQIVDVKPSEVEKDVTFKTKISEVKGAAAVVVDDKKEGNVETYLKMLQLLEKVDLVNTTEIADCPVCFNTVPMGEGIVLRDCLHIFCKECLIGAVQYAEDSEVKCPFRDDSYSCNSALQEREIKALVPPNIFEKYLARSVKLAESKMVNTFHCKTNDCTGWCIFEDDVNIFKCPVCQRKNCLTCQAIHEGIDCQQYQRELAIAAETDENAKSSRLMLEQMIQRGEALECPACHVVLLKKWGCDWVRCTYCKTEICWVTRNFRWGPGGKGDTSGGCKCGVNGIRCHPKCTYCH